MASPTIRSNMKIPSKLEDYICDPTKWDTRFLRLAQEIAGWSEDRSRKVGSVIVGPSNEIRSTGFNGLPRGISSDFEERHDRADGKKYLWFEHAERNAIYNAARIGVSVYKCRIYSTLFPCADCLRGIIQCGISELVTYFPPENDTDAMTFEFEDKFKVSWKLTEKIRIYNLGEVARLKGNDYYKAKIGIEVSL